MDIQIIEKSASEIEFDDEPHFRSVDDEEECDKGICSACDGSGEGMYEGTSCGTCSNPRGSRRNHGRFHEG